MKHFLLLSLILISFGSFAESSKDHFFNKMDPKEDPRISSVQIETSGCMGKCPVFSFFITLEGNAEYVGYLNTKFKGTRTGKLSKYSVEKLFDFIHDIDVFRFKDKYTADITDSSTTTTTIIMKNGKVKVIENYANLAPSFVWAMEQLIISYEPFVEWNKTKK